MERLIGFFKKMTLKTKIIVSSATVFVIALIVCVVLLACNNRIYNGISVGGVDVGGMTVSQAAQKLSPQKYTSALPAFVYEDRKFTVSPESISLECDGNASALSAQKYGKNPNPFVRIWNNFKYMFNPVDLPVIVSFDDVALNTELDKYIGDLRTPSMEPQIRVEEDKLIIKNGSQGLDINREKLKTDLSAAVMGKTDKIELALELITPTPISAQSLYDDYVKEAVDATYSISNMRISYTESVDGLSFDMESAKKILNDNADNTKEYFIPLSVVKAKSIEDIDKELFGERIGTYTSYYKEWEVGRTKNVTQATRSINNVVLQPGDVFSYNNILGERTAERGYAGAKVYAGGEVVEGLGGGICQVSSTLYNTVLYADLQVVSRTCHSLPVTYVPLGRDATVSYGVIDFKFKNQYDFPVKISASAVGGELTVSIYGKNPKNKTVELYTERLSTIPFSVVEKMDASIAEGQTKVKQEGSNGAVVNTYKKVIENGTVVSNKMIHTSRYSPINKIILVPFKEEEPPVEAPPSDLPEEIPSTEAPEEETPDTPADAPAEIPAEQEPTEDTITE